MAITSQRAVVLVIVVVLSLAALLHARHPARPPRRPAPHFQADAPVSGDQHAAASGHGHHHGRVQIKVYRGPDHHHHAPHGYWVKQPADDPPHHHR